MKDTHFLKLACLLPALFLAASLLAQPAEPPPNEEALDEATPPAAPEAAAPDHPVTNGPSAPQATPTPFPPPPVPTINQEKLEELRRALRASLTNRNARTLTNLAPARPTPLPASTPAAVDAAGNPTVQPGTVLINPPPGATTASATGTNGFALRFENSPLAPIFSDYARLTGRTVLQPANLGVTGVTIVTQGELTREEAIQALDGALALNGIVMIPQGAKFVKAVPAAQGSQEGAAMSSIDPKNLPDAEQFITQVVRLKTVTPSDVAQVLQSFTKNPAGIAPIDPAQIIVLRDYASNVRRMVELLKQIDVEPESEYHLEILPIKFGRVSELYDTLNSLVTGVGGNSFGAGATAGRFGTSRTGTGAGGGTGTNRMNSLMQMQNQATGRVVNRNNTTARGATGGTFQQRLQNITRAASGGGEVQVLGDARIVPDERSNTLIVYANKTDLAMITNIVAKIDQLLAQVLIEAIVLEVGIGDSLDFAVSAVQRPNQMGDLYGGGGYNNTKGFFNPTNFPNGLSEGFTYFGQVQNWNFMVQAVAKDSNIKILSRPRIQTSHATPGRVVIAQAYPYLTSTYDYSYGGVAGSGARSSYQMVNIGIQLEVTPFITPEGLVVLQVLQTVDSKGQDVIIDSNPVPIINKREAEGLLTVADGDAVMLGGYITETREKSNSGVPILKDIPLIGPLFRSTHKRDDRVELFILMRATVLRDVEAAAQLVRREKQQIPGALEAEREFKELNRKRLQKLNKSQDTSDE